LPQFIFEELLMRFGAGPSQPIKKGGKESPFHKIEFRDENYHSIEDFIFYYSRLEVPVARNKALLLAELLLRVKRRNFDGTDPPDTDDEASDAGKEAEEDEEESNVHVVEEKAPLEPPNPNQKLEWTRHTDDNGYPYFFNWKTQESTYDNPFLSQHERDKARFPFLAGDSESESDDELEADKRVERQMAEGIMIFCSIMMQRNFRGGRSRNATRVYLAKTFRKIKNPEDEDPPYVYENVETGDIWKQRPVLFKYLWPNSKF
jgi:hypothetical protein